MIPYPGAAVTVTLTSDAGVETTVSDGSGEFQFKSVAPGPYELFSQAAADVAIAAERLPVINTSPSITTVPITA